MAHTKSWTAASAVAALVIGGMALATAPTAQAADWRRCLEGSSDRQAAFARAADVSGVPERVLLAVSFMQSRWDDHGRRVSATGGYGPMHLTQDAAARYAAQVARARGESLEVAETRGTLTRAAEITGFSRDRLRVDDVANICGGAAVLAASQPPTASKQPSQWTEAVATFAGDGNPHARLAFAERVFEVLRTGAARTTNDGQRVELARTPGARVDRAAVDGIPTGNERLVCPRRLGCESVPAPYELLDDGTDPLHYGNHDLAERPGKKLGIDYIVVHDTEASYDTTLDLVTDPAYVSWHYTLRSSDGHVAQHVNPKNVAWHAGNWYVNMHSIGLEHEGFAADGASWYTESLYRSSADLVRHLASRYHVPLDRAHIIGHDQVPGTVPSTIPGMHWDPGPYWDWEHYMRLLGSPMAGRGADAGWRPGDVVTVVPGFAHNTQAMVGCDEEAPEAPCRTQGTNFVPLYQEPSLDAPLVPDTGLRPGSTESTNHVSDIGPRAAAGHQFVVAERRGGWTGVWYLGRLGWLKNTNAAGRPVLRVTHARTVDPAGTTAVPVYGRAYPEASAYPEEIPAQAVTPLGYTIESGQDYVLAGGASTDYYYAKSYDDSLAGDHTVVRGRDRYLQIWFGHRAAYVRAADVEVGHRR